MDRLIAAVLFFLLGVGVANAQTSCGTLSNCPSASQPLNGTELMYLVQQGVSKKETTGQLALQLEKFLTLNVGVIPIVGGTNNCMLYNASQILGCLTLGTNVFSALQQAENGSGALAGTTSPVFVTPNLGTPSAAILTNATGLPISGVAGWGANVAAALANALDTASGLVSYSNLATDVKTVLSMSTSVSAAIQNVVNGASGLLQLNASGQIPVTPQLGVTTNSNAAAGVIGEFITSQVAANAVAVITTTATDLTSVTLSAGDWDCWGTIHNTPGSATTTTAFGGFISTAPNTAPTAESAENIINGISTTGVNVTPTGSTRITCTSAVCTTAYGTTNSALLVYLEAFIGWTGASMNAGGQISCRRMR